MTTSPSVLPFPGAPAAKRPRGAQVTQDVVHEHGALLRRLAQLQQRVSDQLWTAERRRRDLEADNIRLRAELVRVRTAMLWNLGPASAVPWPAPGHRAPAPQADSRLREARAVICQTGCAGHAHPWLEPDGQCRRTGQTCDRLEDETRPAATRGAGASDPE